MSALRRLLVRVSALFRRHRLDADLDEELATHVELAVEDNIKQGMSAQEARRRALVSLGGRDAARELHRESRGLPVLETIFQDLRFAFRVLGKRPWLTAMVVIVLAAGIGVNTTVFTLFHAVYIRGLPFPESHHVFFVESNDLTKDRQGMSSSYPDFADWRAETRAFDDLAGFARASFNLSDDSTAPERFGGARVTANTFHVLRIDPVRGRDFLPEEEQPGANRVVLISHGVWQDRYGGDPGILDQTIRIDGQPYTVVGVMPPGFHFPTEADLWLPLIVEGDWLKRDSRRLAVVGRLAETATLTDARQELDLLAHRLRQEYPATNKGIGVHLLSGNENFSGGQIRTMFLAMLGAVGFVLLIACANVANVQLTRAADRQKEISIRSALGAGRWRIVRQLLIESVVLAAAGGLVGLALSAFGVRFFDDATYEARPYFIQFTFDASVFAYVAAICVVTGVLFGLAPSVYALRTDVNKSLKEGSRGQTGGSGARRFSTALVIGEVALSVVLLVGAGLMMRSFWNVYHMDLGVRTDDRLMGLVFLPQPRYPDPADRLAFHESILTQLRALPGVTAVTTASDLPGNGFSSRPIEIEGDPIDDPDQRPSEAVITIGTDYFQALDANLVRGRAFTASDTRDAPPAAIVNQGFAEKHWPSVDPIGKRFKLGDEENRDWITVVGVSPDIRQNNASEPEVRPLLYLPYSQAPGEHCYILLHATTNPISLADAFRSTIAAVDPHLPVQDVMLLEQRMERSRWAYPLFGTAFSVFAVIAVTLAALGVFALVADSVRRRIPEFGIRLALGAAPAQILGLVLSQALSRVGLGVALGLPLAYGAAQILDSMLVGVGPSDAVTLGGVACFLLVVALVACWLPARRVISIHPSTALRHE